MAGREIRPKWSSFDRNSACTRKDEEDVVPESEEQASYERCFTVDGKAAVARGRLPALQHSLVPKTANATHKVPHSCNLRVPKDHSKQKPKTPHWYAFFCFVASDNITLMSLLRTVVGADSPRSIQSERHIKTFLTAAWSKLTRHATLAPKIAQHRTVTAIAISLALPLGRSRRRIPRFPRAG